MHKRLKDSPYCIEAGATIADALAAITENLHGTIVVVREDGTLVGVVSDGDIRRALLKKGTTLTPLEKIVNPNVLSVKEGKAKEEGEAILQTHREIMIVPVVDAHNVVVDIIAR